MVKTAAIIFGGVAAVADAAIPTVSLGKDVNGKEVLKPLVGAGTWQYNDTVAYSSVCQAFAAGYTFVDTANGYRNQKGVGQAIKDCWKGTREELFVMTKIPGGLSREETLAAHRENMDQLGLDYVDHLMTHFPADWAASPERASPARRQEEWKALEEVYNSGDARSIGISHYCSQHIDDVLAVATVMPSVNQVEYHVGSQDIDNVIQKCKETGIKFMSFSPLCGPCDISDPKDSLISGDLVTSIGAKYGKTGAQIALRWIVQQALTTDHIAGVIPKSNTASHLAANIDLFDFELSDEDMQALSAATEPAAEDGDCDVTAVV
jgi:diketogulonate reductase-like aldo/keto reductase